MTQALTVAEKRDLETRQRLADEIDNDINNCVRRWSRYYPFAAGNKYRFTWRVIHHEYFKRSGVQPRRAAQAARSDGVLSNDHGINWLRVYGDMQLVRRIVDELVQPRSNSREPPTFFDNPEYRWLFTREENDFSNANSRTATSSVILGTAYGKTPDSGVDSDEIPTENTPAQN